MNIIFYLDNIKLCPECFNEELMYDERRAELYCTKCGLIVLDSSIINRTEYEDIHVTIEKFREYLYMQYDNDVVDRMLMDIFKQ